ncbi:hypothetical protein KP509_22G068800 [Ceratopteris richardii]|uniref:Uncharacterized protein n=1 Tax=Ceratopteris richardii TaxID=49495 RepID=A0A8T2S639_CERRI|nr:hypothetical protein KP509_22G068800 [Ceratopteris richardii]
MNEFGQHSVASLLLQASGSSRDKGKEVSLTDFLERKSRVIATRKRLGEENKEGLHIEPQPSSADHRVCDSLAAQRLSKKNRVSKTFEHSSRQTDFGRSHVLVLGDSPLQRLTTQKRRAQPLYRKYNHYDDGRGWWDEEMVGMEELGTTYEWEGVASMSFGSTTTPASP